MNRYGQLDQELANIHRVLLIADADSSVTQIDRIADREAEICDQMRTISRDDHAQVEGYRAAQGWKPCFDCQDKARHPLPNFAVIARDALQFAEAQSQKAGAVSCACQILIEDGWQDLNPFTDQEIIAIAVMNDHGLKSDDIIRAIFAARN